MNADKGKTVRTLSHWGAYDLEVTEGKITNAKGVPHDPDPSPIGDSIPGAVHHRSRITQPMARKGWLEAGPDGRGKGAQGGRGQEPFVPLSWDEALDLATGELKRVRDTYSNEAIFGGSYGWASAGRFHHCQSQLHRFLNCFGGYVRHVDSYSSAAGRVILPHVVGMNTLDFQRKGSSWDTLSKHCELMVMFGGAPMRNAQVEQGGANPHVLRDAFQKCKENGVEFINISPLRDDLPEFLEAEWISPRPNSDTALMLGLAYVLISENLHDEAFLNSHCVGFDKVRDYILGKEDGVAKTPTWAHELCGLEAEAITTLARRLAAKRSLITMSLSLQRAQYGEQPFWMAVTLAALLGGIGKPGQGISFSVGAFNNTGRQAAKTVGPTFAQGRNPVDRFIPVARIVDMLERPGEPFDYNGKTHSYPDVKLVYWCGGNPFHHHQDINRMIEAWQKPETIIFHEPWWTPAAKHADLVFPATTPYERNDIGQSFNSDQILAMKQVISPVGQARDDFAILVDLADRLEIGNAFHEGRSTEAWLRHIYDEFTERAAHEGANLPDFDAFWRAGDTSVPMDGEYVLFQDFRKDPIAHPLRTPSGKIELYSEKIAEFGYADCPPHASWIPPQEWLGAERAATYPFHLTSHQPTARLHSQLDCGAFSLQNKVADREPALINPQDAAPRGIEEGDIVEVFNDRGACLAGAIVTNDVMPGVIALATGAWYDAQGPGELERHGNPNVLTQDIGTSRLAQGCTAHSALVDVRKYDGVAPAHTAHEPPEIAQSV